MSNSRNPIRLLAAQLLVKTGLNRFFIIHMNGYKLRFSNSALAVTLFADKQERNNDEDLLRRVLPHGGTYVDVGANIGTLVFPAARIVGPEGKVVGIEAHPQTFKNLEANVTLNRFPNIEIIHTAAGNSTGEIFFSNMNTDDQNKVVEENASTIRVPVNTLDKILINIAYVSVLKIDVEGYEKFVLEGAAEVLGRTDVVLYESWDSHFLKFGYNAGVVAEFFYRNDFRVYRFKTDKLMPFTTGDKSEVCENLLAIRRAREDMLKSIIESA